jgi:HAD superfamily hydrolase (TIGR01509 family)
MPEREGSQHPDAPAALLFDLDGTLAETSHTWRQAEDALFAAIGHAWSDEVQRHYMGMNASDLASTVHRLLKPDLPIEECRRIMRESLIGAYRDASPPEIPGAVALVRRLQGRTPMAVASGSPLEGIEVAPKHLGIRACFDAVLSTESVPRGKPHPDGFLAAAGLLDVPPERCMVFEDSQVGAEAARAAGMRCMVRPRSPEYSSAIAPIATRIVRSWDEVTVADIFGEA